MGTNQAVEPLQLGAELTKRLEQLGISRRELVRRTMISRQTLHKIEHEGHTTLWDETYRQLDEGLYWLPGTARQLAHGELVTIQQADALTQIDRESAYRWRIVERIQSMSLADLEKLVAMMEGERLGSHPSTLLPTDDVIALVERKVEEAGAAIDEAGG